MEGQAQTLALQSPRPVSSQGRGQGYTQRANCYYVQKAVGTLALEPTLNTMRPVTPEDYHSAQEPSKFEYESEGLEGHSMDSTGIHYTFGISSISCHVWLKGTKHSNSVNDINNDVITQMTSPHPKSYKRSVCSKINRYSN